MLEYETTIGDSGKSPEILAPALNYHEIIIDGRDPKVRQEKLLGELKSRLKSINPNITAPQMACSIQETLELNDDELRKIIPEGDSDDHVTESFVGLWYLASIYGETFARDIRLKHEKHMSFGTTEPTSHLNLILEKGVTPVLMQHYEIFKGE